MSSIAYESTSTINSWSCKLCKSNPLSHVTAFTNKGGDLQGFTGYSAALEGIVLSFRGSSNIQNWITNLQVGQTTYSKCSSCKVHSGFLAAWKIAKDIVVP